MGDSVIIGNRLKAIREIRKKTANQVASDLNMKQSTYSNYETGRRCPRADVLMEFCEYFDVEPNYIYGVSPIPYSLAAGTADVRQRLEEMRKVDAALETITQYVARRR